MQDVSFAQTLTGPGADNDLQEAAFANCIVLQITTPRTPLMRCYLKHASLYSRSQIFAAFPSFGKACCAETDTTWRYNGLVKSEHVDGLGYCCTVFLCSVQPMIKQSGSQEVLRAAGCVRSWRNCLHSCSPRVLLARTFLKCHVIAGAFGFATWRTTGLGKLTLSDSWGSRRMHMQ